jgi:hypothetical protein
MRGMYARIYRSLIAWNSYMLLVLAAAARQACRCMRGDGIDDHQVGVGWLEATSAVGKTVRNCNILQFLRVAGNEKPPKGNFCTTKVLFIV